MKELMYVWMVEWRDEWMDKNSLVGWNISKSSCKTEAEAKVETEPRSKSEPTNALVFNTRHDTTRHGTKRYIRTISSWIQFVFVSLLLNCATNNLSLSLFFARSLANDLRLFFLLLLTSVGDTVGSDAASAWASFVIGSLRAMAAQPNQRLLQFNSF